MSKYKKLYVITNHGTRLEVKNTPSNLAWAMQLFSDNLLEEWGLYN